MRLIILVALFLAAPLAAQTSIDGDLPRKGGRPLEATPGLETRYSVVRTSEGLRLRSILTRPAGARGPLPAIFLAKWVSCGSAEFRPDRTSELKQLARRSGLVMIRVERAGEGDSEGACDKLDFDTEVRHYREALAALRNHPWVDARRIVIFGSSLGAMTAPLIADGMDVAGVLVQGGGAVSYLERMIGFDRLQMERSGRFTPADIAREMPRRIAFQQLYLLGAKPPATIAAERPDLAGVWESLHGTAPDKHYGRPFAWHWQAARVDALSAWSRLAAPVMVVYGELDGFEMRHGHRLIVDTANRLRPGSGSWLEIARAGHDLDIYPTPDAAWRMEGGTSRPELFVDPVLDWLGRVTGVSGNP
jgi:pimeloyl-ACP methyl ester carboxylesterase